MYKAWMIDDTLELLETPTSTLAVLRREYHASFTNSP